MSAFAQGRGIEAFFPLYLLLCIPIALISFLTVKIRNLWLYLALCGATILGVYFIFSSWVVLAAMVIFVVVKISGRLAGNNTVFDAPHPAGVAAFILPFIYSAYMKEEKFQLAILCAAVVYFAITFLYGGIKRVGAYIGINEKMYNFPGKRIDTKGMVIFSGVTAAILLIAIPVVVSNFSMLEITPPDNDGNYQPTDIVGADQGVNILEKPEWMEANKDAKPPIDLSFLSDLIIYVGLAAFIVAVGYGIYRLTKNFDMTIREKNDIIETTGNREGSEKIKDKGEKLGIFDFSPNAFIRKKYIRRVRSSKKPLPFNWQSPEEIERETGEDFGSLHFLYEKARYSEGGCTGEDKESL